MENVVLKISRFVEKYKTRGIFAANIWVLDVFILAILSIKCDGKTYP